MGFRRYDGKFIVSSQGIPFPSLSESSGFPTLPFYECLLKRVLEAKNDNLAKLVLVQVNFTKKIDESQENKREYNLFSRKLGNKRGYE